jgi:hypothetical protein
MNRNQKIALGCGGAGCLGLIVVVIAATLIYIFAYSRTSGDFNYNVTTNRNANLNDNSDSADTDDNDNSNSSSTSTSAASSMSDDDKHKLYQAAYMTGDPELIRRVNVKLGLLNDDFTAGENYEQFLTEHVNWVFRNTDFIQSISTPEKARTYVDANFPD